MKKMPEDSKESDPLTQPITNALMVVFAQILTMVSFLEEYATKITESVIEEVTDYLKDK